MKKLEKGKNRTYFSVSSLKAYLKCPYCYYLRYIAKIEVPTVNERMHFGSAIHAGLAQMYRGKPYRPAFLAALNDGFEKVRHDNGSVPRREDMTEEGFTMLSVYEQKRYFFGQVIGVEQQAMIDLKHPDTGESLSIPMMVRIDLLLDNGIVDHKVKANAFDPYEASVDIQKVAYWMAYEQMYGHEPEYFAFNQLLRRKGMPKIEKPLRFTVSRQEKVAFFETAKRVLADIDAGKFERSQSSRYHDYDLLCN